jgi:hypothetical protein
LGEFLGYLEWLGPNHKYFSETEGPAVIFRSAQGPRQNLQEAYGPKCKIVKNYGFLIIIFQWKIRWTRSTPRAPCDAAQVQHGLRRRGQEGARARQCSPVAVEEDEPDEAVLTRARAVAKRRRDRGEERRQFELIARAKEGGRELVREGKKEQ